MMKLAIHLQVAVLMPLLKRKKNGLVSHNKALMTAFTPTDVFDFDWENTVKS